MADSSQTPETSLLQAMAGLCAELDIQVIADGVTAHEQTAMLRNLNCRLGQGPLYRAPRGPQELNRTIAGPVADRTHR